MSIVRVAVHAHTRVDNRRIGERGEGRGQKFTQVLFVLDSHNALGGIGRHLASRTVIGNLHPLLLSRDSHLPPPSQPLCPREVQRRSFSRPKLTFQPRDRSPNTPPRSLERHRDKVPDSTRETASRAAAHSCARPCGSAFP